MKEFRTYLFPLTVVLLLMCSCEKPIPVPGPEPDPDPTPDPVVPTMYYSVNGVKHEITNVAVYSSEGEGYNIVFSDDNAPLCPDYDLIGNCTYNLFSVDLAAFTEGKKIVIVEDDIESDVWMFYIAEWSRNAYSESFSDAPVSGSYEYELDGNNLKIDLSVKFEGDLSYEVVYDGPFVQCDDYIWCGMSGKGSFGVDNLFEKISSATLYHDKSARGYELKAFSSEKTFIVDFSENLVGKISRVGVDPLTPREEGQTTIWSFLTVTVIDGETARYVDGQNSPFESGYVDCAFVTDDRVDFDMSINTIDGHTLNLHYHGDYSEAYGLER